MDRSAAGPCLVEEQAAIQRRVARRNANIFLDPQFWQSLGKALGWATQFDEDKGFNYQWKDYWHKFIDHLADGKDIESFFKDL